MAQKILAFGVTLIVLGVVAFLPTDWTRMGPLVPAFFGWLYLAVGAYAMKQEYRVMIVKVLAGLTTAALLVSLSGPIGLLIGFLKEDTPIAPAIPRLIMFVLCALFMTYTLRLLRTTEPPKPDASPLRFGK